MERRDILKTLGGGAALALAGPALAFPQRGSAFGGPAFAAAITRAEARTQGRLGVAVLDLATGARFASAGDERFAMCSTFKFLLSAAVLHAADAGRLSLAARCRSVAATAAQFARGQADGRPHDDRRRAVHGDDDAQRQRRGQPAAAADRRVDGFKRVRAGGSATRPRGSTGPSRISIPPSTATRATRPHRTRC